MVARRKSMIQICTTTDLAAMQAKPRAFVFLWVNWSGPAINSRSLVEQVVTTWHTQHPEQQVPCYSIDVSDQSGEVWDGLVAWLTAEGRPAGNLMYGGAGPLLWVRSGHVILHVLSSLQYDCVRLVAASRSVFNTGTEPAEAPSDVGQAVPD